MIVNTLPFLAVASTPVDEDRNSPEGWTAWIESVSTPKTTYGPSETVNTTVTVERGPDVLTAVWEGDLVLAVLDWTGDAVHYDDLYVALNVGGAQQTSHFEFDLDEVGDYLLRVSLYRLNDTMVDRQDLNLTVTQQNRDPIAIIDPVSQTVELGIEATFDGSRSNDPDGNITTYMWDFGDGTSAEGPTATHTYRVPGKDNVTLTVTDEHGATGTVSALVEVVANTPPPGDVPVWVSDLVTGKGTYEVGEVMDVTVVVTRGPDMLTYVWEGTLVLERLDPDSVHQGMWERPVYLAHGGATQTITFAVEPAMAGPCGLVASLYWMDGAFVDTRQLNVTVTERDENLPPVAVIDPVNQSAGVGDPVLIDGFRSHDDDGRIASYLWDLGDGTTAEGPTVNHSYLAPGLYKVTLTVTDDDGDVSVASGAVQVLGFTPPPYDAEAWIVSITAKGTVNESETITVTAAVVRGGDMLDYVWLGSLVLEFLDNGTDLTLTEQVALATGGEIRTLSFEFSLTEPGDYLVRATLYGQDDALVDVEEAGITVIEGVQDPPAPADEGEPNLPATAVAAAGILVILGALAATEVGKLSLMGLFIPLYTKLKKEDVLEHFTRGKIYGYILANPGDHYNSIQKALNIANGTFAYHLHVLEKEGYIRSARYGTYRCFFPAEMKIPSQEGALRASQRLIVEKILEEPGISQKDIASSLGVSPSTVCYHIKGLLKLGLVETERQGMRLKYYINQERNPSPG